jgi:cyclic di-GMP phosphodiesterase Gmr
VESSEELREALVGMQREIDRLRTETTHAALLINALEALLFDGDGDPFAGVFVALRSVFHFSHAVVLVERQDGDEILVCAVADPGELVDSHWKAGSLFRKVLAGRVTATLTNHELEEWQGRADGHLSSLQPALYLPMRVRERRGFMMLLRSIGAKGFDRNDVALARKFVLLASHAFAARHAHQSEAETHRLRSLTLQLQESQQALAHRANHDHLTELPNRSFMRELVERTLQLKAEEHRVAVAFIDLNGFKQVNDLHGHAVGDAMLKSVASRVRASVRENDVVGRISGDEFLILFNGVHSLQGICAIADRVLDELTLPFLLDGLEISISASIGIALHPDHGTDYDSLRRNADIAMYKAKTGPKGGVALYDSEMGNLAAARLSLERRLRQGIRDGQFRCAYQPKVDLASRRIVGFEALVRWIDDEGKEHAPDTFIAAASEFQLLNGITLLVLQDTRDSMPLLDAKFGPHTKISINVSAKQASDPLFMAHFVAELAATRQPSRFILEVTEDAFLATTIFQQQVLPLLRQIGVSVSIDDFGTGYSSLSALADITADELKVDRSFISCIHQRPRNQSILKAVESLGQALGMVIVAEGVETQDELDYLLSKTSIRMAQGYFFSRPCFIGELLQRSSVKAVA